MADDGQRGEAEKKRTETAEEKAEAGSKESTRETSACHDVYRVATNVVAAEKRS